jgi:hypothetical protein
MVKTVFALLGLVCLGSAKWEPEHNYTPEASAQVASAIKDKL